MENSQRLQSRTANAKYRYSAWVRKFVRSADDPSDGNICLWKGSRLRKKEEEPQSISPLALTAGCPILVAHFAVRVGYHSPQPRAFSISSSCLRPLAGCPILVAHFAARVGYHNPQPRALSVPASLSSGACSLIGQICLPECRF